MNLSEVTDDELVHLREAYAHDLRHETMASHSVKRFWKIVVALINQELAKRNGVLSVLDGTKIMRPGDEPLA
jgi:hypothetical protein